VAETYTSGAWTVRPGAEEEFVAAWKEFVGWASEWEGSGTFRLVRDLDQPNRFMSFAPWQSFEAQKAWKQDPEFPARIRKVRQYCEDFVPLSYELVAQVD
jgi:heme-degrading monooxygenase HmoA